MNLEQILKDMKAERDRLTRMIDAYEGVEALEIERQCTECGLTVKGHLGLRIHMSKKHGIDGAKTAKVKAIETFTNTKKRELGARLPKPQPKDRLKARGLVNCIDCGQGPFTEEHLDEHLKTCNAFKLADRSNGKH